MPLHDKDFGKKLLAMEQAVGFRFPPADFRNTFLATLLHTTPETMSRKKKGERRVTDADWSVLTEYFDLARYGFEAGMFAEELLSFEQRMADVGRLALADAKPNQAWLDLYELATGPNGGTLRIDQARRALRGGIGTKPSGNNLVVLHVGDEVTVRTEVAADGFLFLLNGERGKEASCLMPSCYAPEIAVRGGRVVVPTCDEFPRFPVGEPAASYRLCAVWFASKPDLSLMRGAPGDDEPRVLSQVELIEFAACAKALADKAGAVMVAMADYEVRKPV